MNDKRQPKDAVAVVPAAGQGLRMGPGPAKQFRRLAGVPLLTHTLRAVASAPCLEAVVVVVPPGQEEATRAQCLEPHGLGGKVRVVPGGARRQDSVANGVQVAAHLGARWVVVHDGVRPLASPALFARVLEAARQHGAAVAALPSSDTVKRAGPGDLVQATVERQGLWLVQTPQAFGLELLQKALERARREDWSATDEAGLVERMGEKVKLVMGERGNLKVTTPEDLDLVAPGLALGGPRVGQGMDVHRLAPDRPLILGGVRLDYHLGLLGHSDADVLTHAVMDALLAAAGLGDIGRLFPDTDPALAGADSLELLDQVVARLAQEGWRPAQVSATLVAQAPKIAPHAEKMRANLAQRLGLAPELVNLAATTSEGLGFTGRGEGMAAFAIATLAPGAVLANPDSEE